MGRIFHLKSRFVRYFQCCFLALTFLIPLSPASFADNVADIVINNQSFNSPNAIASDGSNIWVANGSGEPKGNGSVSKIDVATGAVTEIDSASFFNPVALVSDGSNIWVANQAGGTDGNGSVSKINISSSTVTMIESVTFNSPCGISYDGTNIWVANQTGGSTGNGSVSKININTGSITEVDSSTFNEPEAIAANSSGVWVANGYGGADGNGSVTRIDSSSNTVTQINSSTFNDITSIAVDNLNVWVTNETGGADSSGSVSKINISTNGVNEVDSSTFSSPNAISSDGSSVWVGDAGGGESGTGSLSEIDIATSKVTSSSHPSITTPDGLVVDGSNVWIANQDGGISGAGSVTKIKYSNSTSNPGTPTTASTESPSTPTPKPTVKTTPKPKSTIKTVPGQPPGTRIPLHYTIPSDALSLTFHVGQTVPSGLSYCLPSTSGNGFGRCGGTDVKNQQEPYGGVKIIGPYQFTYEKDSGYLPMGLVLHNNGALTGTVNTDDVAKTYPFTICVSEVGIAPSPGNTDTVCQKTKIIVKSESSTKINTKQSTTETKSKSGTTTELPLTVFKISLSGGGSGTVTDNYGHVDCGLSKCQNIYTLNTKVTLTAHPNVGSVFTGWEPMVDAGSATTSSEEPTPCQGLGKCVVKIDQAQNVYAGFEIDHGFDGDYSGTISGQAIYKWVIDNGLGGVVVGSSSTLTAPDNYILHYAGDGNDFTLSITQGEIYIAACDVGLCPDPVNVNQKILPSGEVTINFPLNDLMGGVSDLGLPTCQIPLHFSRGNNYYDLELSAVTVGTVTCNSGGISVDLNDGYGKRTWTWTGTIELSGSRITSSP